MEGKIEGWIARLEGARRELNQALESIPSEIEIYPSWKLKQLLDHITGWDELMVSVFTAHSKGGAPIQVEIHGIDQYNQEMLYTRKALTFEVSRRAFDATRAEVIRVLREMPPERLEEPFQAPWGGKCTIEDAVEIFVRHEEEHARHIHRGSV